MHKKSGELALVRRVWLEADVPFNVEYAIQINAAVSEWAFENKHGIVFVLPIKAQEEFEDLGEL